MSKDSIPGNGKTIFSSQICPNQILGSTNLLYEAYEGPFPRVNWLGHNAGHLPPSSAEVKNVWSYTSLPHVPSWCVA
jgi:hypothetical protein